MRLDAETPVAPIERAPEILKAMASAYVKANTGKGMTSHEAMELAVNELLLGLQKRGHYDASNLIAAVVLGWEWRNEVTR
jgi:hypothetical protein